MHLLYEKKRITNYVNSFESKKAKPSEQRRKRRTEKRSDNEGDEKRQEVKECKIYGGKHLGAC